MPERQPIQMTKEDYETIKKVRQMTQRPLTSGGTSPGILTCKSGDVDSAYKRMPADGDFVPNDPDRESKGKTPDADSSQRRVRGRERRFVGSPTFPNGVVVGFTDIEQRRTIDGSDWSHAHRQDDISATENEWLEALAFNRPYLTQAEILAHSAERERKRAANAAQPILSEQERIEIAASAQGKAMAESLRQMQTAGKP